MMASLQSEVWLIAGRGFGSGEDDAITLGRVDNDNWGKLGSGPKVDAITHCHQVGLCTNSRG